MRGWASLDGVENALPLTVGARAAMQEWPFHFAMVIAGVLNFGRSTTVI